MIGVLLVEGMAFWVYRARTMLIGDLSRVAINSVRSRFLGFARIVRNTAVDSGVVAKSF